MSPTAMILLIRNPKCIARHVRLPLSHCHDRYRSWANSSDSDLDECSSPACHESHAPNSAQCPQHTSIPRCQHQELCNNTELSGTQYCNTHRCQKSSCRNQAVSPNGKCEFHVTCAEGGCRNTRAEKTEGGYENYCYQRKEVLTSLSCKSQVSR